MDTLHTEFIAENTEAYISFLEKRFKGCLIKIDHLESEIDRLQNLINRQNQMINSLENHDDQKAYILSNLVENMIDHVAMATNTIEKIKIVRQKTGMGLKAAKLFVEKYFIS